MRYLVLATDYDGTLATDGKVDDATLNALVRLRASGRKLLLVTGRELPDLKRVFPRLDLFDRVVADNGGLLYQPATRAERLLCEAPNPRFVALLRERNVPVSVGRAVVASWEPHDAEVLRAIRELGLDLQVAFNKGSVMVLPAGINKGSGLLTALDELGISPHNVVSVGDAENDHSFLRISECAAAVANALPALKERADVVLQNARGAGVVELAEKIIADDLLGVDASIHRHAISLGLRARDSSQPVSISQRAGSILVAGSSGSGKSTTVAGILEQLAQQGYQFCVLDPEGDYDGSAGLLTFGTAKEPPDTKAALRALNLPQQSVLINLLGVKLDDRPGYFASLLPLIQEMHLRTARPHWLVVDEAHHLLPADWAPATNTVSQLLESAILTTVHPEHVAKSALDPVKILVAVGKAPMQTFRTFATVVQTAPPPGDEVELATGEALVWFRDSAQPPIRVHAVQGAPERRRHSRQYSEGELSPQQSFYFRGPDATLNLRAQNLKTFLQMAEGVDDRTWMYHLRRGDYSHWFRTMIKDDDLARETAAIEQDETASPQASRQMIRQAVSDRYTAPA